MSWARRAARAIEQHSSETTPPAFLIGESDPWLVPSVNDLRISGDRQWTTVTHVPTDTVVQVQGGSMAAVLEAVLAMGAALGQTYMFMDAGIITAEQQLFDQHERPDT